MTDDYADGVTGNGPWPADEQAARRQRAEQAARENDLQQERRFIGTAFYRHISDSHGADFEVCDHPDCQTAYQVEQRLRAAGVYPFGAVGSPLPEGDWL